MKKTIAIAAVALFALAGCGEDPERGVLAPVVITPTPAPPPTSFDESGKTQFAYGCENGYIPEETCLELRP